MVREFSSSDRRLMREALEIASRGEGYVEPNPMVGCIIAQDNAVIGRGYHQRFGDAHAEVNALQAAGATARGGTAYVTLEPCCHTGKTPPCSTALIEAGIARVVVAQQDPFPQVDGGGIQQLRAAGIEVDVGLLNNEAQQLNAPYLKRLLRQRPWVIAKWAMTLDGKIASRQLHSQWISGSESRKVVHQLRGRVDAVMVGRQTAAQDDPLLTARPPGPRTPARIVVDSLASLNLASQLVQSSQDPEAGPVIIAVTASPNTEDSEARAHADRCQALGNRGCEVIRCDGDSPLERLDHLLCQLAARGVTNVLVEGGGQLLGTLSDLDQIDEVHVFIAPKIVGGSEAITPIGGKGRDTIDLAMHLAAPAVRQLDSDVYVSGRIATRGDSQNKVSSKANDDDP